MRYRVDGEGWTVVDAAETIHGPGSRGPLRTVIDRVRSAVPGTSSPERSTLHEQAIADLIEALRDDRPPVQDADIALAALDVVFGAWESDRWPGRIDLPVMPLEAMLEEGRLDPTPAESDPEKTTAGA